MIRHLPPSARTVLRTLERNGSLTQKDIIRESYLPPRTVRFAIDRLREKNLIVERFCFRDARQSLYMPRWEMDRRHALKATAGFCLENKL